MRARRKNDYFDAVWNVVQGCAKVSPGCDNCTSAYTVSRLAQSANPKTARPLIGLAVDWGREWSGLVNLSHERLDEPVVWLSPRRIAVAPLGDLFHEGVPDDFLLEAFRAMHAARQHTYLLSTKRPERMLEFSRRLCLDERKDTLYLAEHGGRPYLPLAPHIWPGVSFEDDKLACERIPILLKIDCHLRVGYYEPALLDPGLTYAPVSEGGYRWNYLTGERRGTITRDIIPGPGLGWVVCSGEVGPGARETQVRHLETVVSQCRKARVPVFLRQLGTNVWEGHRQLMLKSFTGDDPAEWPDDLRSAREFPEAKE